MYRVYDNEEAIRRVQTYLSTVVSTIGTIAPNGIYDDKTRRAVIEFQKNNRLDPTGIVDYTTFTELYEQYRTIEKSKSISLHMASFIQFPILRGQWSQEMIHINRIMGELLEYYGHTHSLRENMHYSDQTAAAVNLLQGIYLLEENDYIDQVLYYRLVTDYDSISRMNKFY